MYMWYLYEYTCSVCYVLLLEPKITNPTKTPLARPWKVNLSSMGAAKTSMDVWVVDDYIQENNTYQKWEWIQTKKRQQRHLKHPNDKKMTKNNKNVDRSLEEGTELQPWWYIHVFLFILMFMEIFHLRSDRWPGSSEIYCHFRDF